MLELLGESNSTALVGLMGGIALGLAARIGRFCTLGAIEDVLYGADDRRLRMWAIAIGIAIIGTHLAITQGYFDTAETAYLDRVWNPLGTIVGEECAPFSLDSLTNPFEFVLLSTPAPARVPDRLTYKHYYKWTDDNHGIVVFDNLGGDSLLVVPSPIDEQSDYSNLARFFEQAGNAQHIALWQALGSSAEKRLHDLQQPIWISVAGGGINWLHLRIDPRAKYYRYRAYRSIE